jgi:hypothetical protein
MLDTFGVFQLLLKIGFLMLCVAFHVELVIYYHMSVELQVNFAVVCYSLPAITWVSRKACWCECTLGS